MRAIAIPAVVPEVQAPADPKLVGVNSRSFQFRCVRWRTCLHHEVAGVVIRQSPLAA